MDRRSALVLLAVFGAGVFLAGLELMITAVALPSILADLVDADGTRPGSSCARRAGSSTATCSCTSWRCPSRAGWPTCGAPGGRSSGRSPCSRRVASWPGLAQSLDQLIAARLVQAVGGGVLVPVGTAAAAHLFGGAARPRALGVIGALTFLGMAAGPFLGAAILATVHPEDALAAPGSRGTPAAVLAPAWRWVFYVNVPIGLVALALAWAAAPGWDTPRRPAGSTRSGRPVRRRAGRRAHRPDARSARRRSPARTSTGHRVARPGGRRRVVGHRRWRSPAALRVSGPVPRRPAVPAASRSARPPSSRCSPATRFATAIIGGAVFVDRVLYGGPDEQRLALGALAGATAVGALVSGLRSSASRATALVTVAGLALASAALAWMAAWAPATPISAPSRSRSAVFGLGFGLTVTPRSTAAVEAAGAAAFGAASSVVTVARMLGMAVGLAVLTAYGSTTIDRLSAEVYATPDAYLPFIPEDAARPAVARPAGRRGARGVGVARGRVDHGRPVRRGRGRDGRRGRAGPGARRPAGGRARGARATRVC